MTTRAKLLAVSAVVALVIVWLWLGSGAVAVREPPHVEANDGDGSAAIAPPPAAATVAVRSYVGDRPSSPGATNDRMKSAARRLATLYDATSSDFVEQLTSKGLSHEDSERIVAEGMHELATCQLDEWRAQAAAQSVPFDAVLDAFETWSTPSFIVFPPLLDSGGVAERVVPCMSSVQQRIGVPAVGFGLRARASTQ